MAEKRAKCRDLSVLLDFLRTEAVKYAAKIWFNILKIPNSVACDIDFVCGWRPGDDSCVRVHVEDILLSVVE